MNTPKLPDREAFETWMHGDATLSLEKDGHGYVDMTVELMWHAWKARAAIEAQGVPDGYERSISQKVIDCHMQKKAIRQAVARGWCSPENADKEMDAPLAEAIASEVLSALASAPPAPQAEDDSAASVNDTNAALAGRYFELLKVVEQYEKSGVTCQTFRHFVSEPCAECNSPGICGKQASVLQQEPVAVLTMFDMHTQTGTVDLCGSWQELRVGDSLYTHHAQQAKPQPLSDAQKQKLLARLRRKEGWDGDGWDLAIIEATEAAHGIKE